MSSGARVERAVAAPMPRSTVEGVPAAALAGLALLSAVMVGVALAADAALGISLLIVICYVPLVLVNLRLGLALWVPLTFLQGVPAFNLGSEVAGLLIVAAWLGNLGSMRDTVVPILRRHRGLLIAGVGLVVWLTLTLAWADDPGLAADDLWRWAALVLLFAVVATTITTADSVRLVAYAFVAGAVVSVALGVVDGSLTSAVEGGARVEGGAGDPNFLAASIVSAAVIAGGLLAGTRSPLGRLLLLAAIAILIAGLVGTASRGGALAAGVTIIAALVFFKHRRAHVLGVLAVVLGIAALTFANAPAAWDRVTDFDDDNGRSDLWYVAWEMGQDNPVGGVGLNNYNLHSADYVQEPGQVEAVRNIVELPHFVHNTYLQLFAEGGIVALVLFLALVLGCLAAAKRAADRFELQGEQSLEVLARAVLVATISLLAAAMFLSAGLDMRMWLLLALGPAMLALASSDERPAGADDRPESESGLPARATPTLSSS